MINVAIIEDEELAAENLKKNIERYSEEKIVEFNIVHFSDAVSFLWNFKSNFDLIFMDICLPKQNGLEISREIRKIDKTVVLIFVSSMAQFAVSGYEVEAMDFIVKPVDYFSFAIKMNRAMEKIKNKEDRVLVLSNETSMVKIKISQLKYVEISGHNIIYHTVHGDFKNTGSLKSVEANLNDSTFARCNSCYLVNLQYVSAINGNIAIVGGDELQVSHPRRKDFFKTVNNYLGGGGSV